MLEFAIHLVVGSRKAPEIMSVVKGSYGPSSISLPQVYRILAEVKSGANMDDGRGKTVTKLPGLQRQLPLLRQF